MANRLQASRDTVFHLITLEENTASTGDVALRTDDGTYVTLDSNGTLRAGAPRIGANETFKLRQEAGGYSLRAANGRFVTAEDGGGRELKANRDQAKSWEIFRFVEVDSNGASTSQDPSGPFSGPSTSDRRRIALETDRGYYIGLERGGNRLLARAVAPGRDETFELVRVSEDRYALRAPNGYFVKAEGGGGASLVADRSEVGEWETFRLSPLGGERFGLLTHRSRFVSADQGGGGALTARSYEAKDWESFRLVERP